MAHCAWLDKKRCMVR